MKKEDIHYEVRKAVQDYIPRIEKAKEMLYLLYYDKDFILNEEGISEEDYKKELLQAAEKVKSIIRKTPKEVLQIYVYGLWTINGDTEHVEIIYDDQIDLISEQQYKNLVRSS